MDIYGNFLKGRDRLSFFFEKVGQSMWLSSFFVFIFFLILNSLIYLTISNVSSADDQWFYTKIAYLLRTEGWSAITNFQGAYFTDLVQSGYSYGVGLYHYFLIPFTFFSDKILGLKISGLFFASLVPTLTYVVLRKFDFKYSLLWIVAFFYALGSLNFTFRLFLNRPFVLVDTLVLLEIYLISQKKYWAFFVVSLVNTWWHPATFWMPVFLAVCFEVIHLLHEKKIDYNAIGYGFAGSISAFFLFPSHSHTFLSSLNPIEFIKTLFSFIYGLDNIGIIAGVENFKGDIFQMISQGGVILAILIFYIILNVIFYMKRRNDGIDLDKNEERVILREYVFMIIIVFFLGYVFSRRFEDLLVPLALLGALISFSLLTENSYVKISGYYVKKIFTYSVLILLIIVTSNRVLSLRKTIGDDRSYLKYEKVGNWLKSNTEKDEIIFNTDFGQFNRLFFYNNWNRYIVGIEPKDMYRHSQEHYWLWHNIIRNGVAYGNGDYNEELKKKIEGKKEEELEEFMANNAEVIAGVIKNKFNSRYIFFDNNIFLKRELDKNKSNYELVYHDEIGGIFVYRIK